MEGTREEESCGFDDSSKENVMAEVCPDFSQRELNTVIVGITSELQNSHNKYELQVLSFFENRESRVSTSIVRHSHSLSFFIFNQSQLELLFN